MPTYERVKIPYLYTALAAIKVVAKLAVIADPYFRRYLTPLELSAWLVLIAACQDFLAKVPFSETP